VTSLSDEEIMTSGSGSLEQQLAVPSERLTTHIDETSLGFTSTQEMAPLEGTIGQERALKALDFGLDVDAHGFNIFVAGAPGSGRNTTLASVISKLAASRPVPNDWVYVHNFHEPMKPEGISLPPGMGRHLASSMDELVVEAKERIPRAFEGGEYQQRVETALTDVHNKHRELTEEMVAEAKGRGVALALTDSGIMATPLGADGEPMTPEQLNAMSEADSERVQEQQKALQEFIGDRISTLRQLEREAVRVRHQVNRDIAEFVLQTLFAELQETFSEHANALAYLEQVREDMVQNVSMFLHQERPQGGPPGLQEMIAGMGGGGGDDMTRYKVNVFVDHSRSQGAPFVSEQSPTYHNLFGRMQHVLRQGVMSTDFTMLSAGAIQKANGGFLVLQVADLLTYPFVWQALKQAIKNRQAKIENVAEQYSLIATSNLEPEAIPLDVKIVLVGNSNLARMLMLHDEDFSKLFKVKAEFGYEFEINTENIKKHAQFIVNRVQEHGLRHFAASGVARLIEHSSRLVEDQERLTARFTEIADLITEAAYCAKMADHDLVTGEDVLRAVQEQRERSNLIEDRLQSLYDEGTIRLEVDGEAVGQINGLAVIDMGDYSFGRPSRLTARVGLGRGDFGSVEQSAQMSGRVHTKGFQILIGYLMGKYGVDATFPFRVSIAFEQTYEEIDGDSASSTEAYALLSAISGVPIKQGFAVTGSVDQHGRVQAIGGATRKIEGFFDVCKSKGLTGSQGVLIPATNIRHLVLRKEVVDAVNAGQFHIYGVETLEQGIELLTGLPAGEQGDDGKYPDGTINAKVTTALEGMAERLRGADRNSRAPRDGEKPVDLQDTDAPDRDPREGPGTPPTPPAAKV
jgi:lon-related putative ATP-dependent protease